MASAALALSASGKSANQEARQASQPCNFVISEKRPFNLHALKKKVQWIYGTISSTGI